VTILERTPAHAAPHSQLAHARQLCTTALVAKWHLLDDYDRATWKQLVPHGGPTAYHAYLKTNLTRILHGLPPSRRWPIDFHNPAGNLTSVTSWTSPNHLHFIINSGATAPRDWDVVWRTQKYPPPAGPHTLAGIWTVPRQTGAKGHDDTNVPPGKWYYYFSGYHYYYGQYTGLGWYTVTIPAP
jgi:hypothetical protein